MGATAQSEQLTLVNIETRSEKILTTMMDALNEFYRAMHEVEDLRDDASAARAALRAQRAG